MKKIICMIMAIVMVMSLVACGNQTDKPTEPNNTPTVNQPENSDNTTTNPDGANGEEGDNNTDVSLPTEEIEGFTYAEELAIALISQTGSVAPVATTRLDLVDVSAIKEATGIENVAKIKNVAVTESVDATKPFKIVLVVFTDNTAASDNVETMKSAVSTLGDASAAMAVKNYAIAVVMNAADSDIVTAQGVCDKFAAMIADEANIYFPTRHLDEEPPVQSEDTESIDDADTEGEPTANENEETVETTTPTGEEDNTTEG